MYICMLYKRHKQKCAKVKDLTNKTCFFMEDHRLKKDLGMSQQEVFWFCYNGALFIVLQRKTINSVHSNRHSTRFLLKTIKAALLYLLDVTRPSIITVQYHYRMGFEKYTKIHCTSVW